MKNKYRIAIAVLLFRFEYGLCAGTAQRGNSLNSSIATNGHFEVESDSKGILPPRMSTLQRDAITTGSRIEYL
jgi:hypothetical protein